MRKIRIATRSSKLAMAQSEYTARRLTQIAPDTIEIEFVTISTAGDRDRTDFLYKMSSVGVFTTEVEKALLTDSADVAVHSLKDLPTTITDGLTIAAIPERESPCDVLIAAGPYTSLDALPPNATVGTSSVRRIAQVRHIRPDLKPANIRGNVETRIKKAEADEFDAIILAEAGLNRLDLAGKISAVLDPQTFLPAPGQGAIAIQTRSDDKEISQLVAQLDDPVTRARVTAERLVLAEMHGGCSIPLGIYTEVEANRITIDAAVISLDGTRYIRHKAACPIADLEKMARALAHLLLDAGARDILDQVNREKA